MKLQIQLQADGAGAAPQQFEIPFAGAPVVIGRGPDSPLPLEGSKLSRNHVAFNIADGALTLTDLSSNGVWVNSQSVPKKHAVALTGSEEISIPGYRLRVRLVLPPPEPAPLPATSSPPPLETVLEPAARAASGSAEENRRVTAELAGDLLPVSGDEIGLAEPPWWQLSAADRFVLFFVALSIALVAYYYSLQ